MLLDLLNQDNYVSFSIKAAHIFGIHTAIYCSVLINILAKATTKQKLSTNGFFKVDRKYITSKSTLSEEDQLKIELNLQRVGIVEKDADDIDLIKFDDKVFASIIADEDPMVLGKVTKELKNKNSPGAKEVKRMSIRKRLENNLVCSDPELRTALIEWIRAVFSRPNGYLSPKAVEEFWNTLNSFTEGDLDVALDVVHIATMRAWIDCKYAIEQYKKNLQSQQERMKTSVNKIVRVTKQKCVTDKKELNDIIF